MTYDIYVADLSLTVNVNSATPKNNHKAAA